MQISAFVANIAVFIVKLDDILLILSAITEKDASAAVVTPLSVMAAATKDFPSLTD